MYESEIYNLIRIKLVKLIDIRIHIVILYYIKIDKKKKNSGINRIANFI